MMGTKGSADWERNFRANMEDLREARGITQTELARRLKSAGLPFHQQTIQRIESGDRPVRLNEAFLIARHLESDIGAMTARRNAPVEELRQEIEWAQRELDPVPQDVSSGLDHLAVTASGIHIDLKQTIARGRELRSIETWCLAWLFKVEAAWRAGQNYLDHVADVAGYEPSNKTSIYLSMMDEIAQWRGIYDGAALMAKKPSPEFARSVLGPNMRALLDSDDRDPAS